MAYKQPKKTPMHNDGASEPITLAVLAALKGAKLIAGLVKGGKALAAGAKAAKGAGLLAKAGKGGKLLTKAGKVATKAGKVGSKTKKGTRLLNKSKNIINKVDKVKEKGSKLIEKSNQMKQKAQKIGGKLDKTIKNVQQGTSKGQVKIDKIFGKVEKATGGKLGNVDEMKEKAGQGIASKVGDSTTKGIAKIQENNSPADPDQFRKNEDSPTMPQGHSYTNPSGVSMSKKYGASSTQIQQGTEASGNVPATMTNMTSGTALDPSNIRKQTSVHKFLNNFEANANVGGINIPLGPLTRLTHALATTKIDAVKKERYKKRLAEIEKSKPISGRKLSAQVEANTDKMSKIAKNIKIDTKQKAPIKSGSLNLGKQLKLKK
jgi:hypothetical protein